MASVFFATGACKPSPSVQVLGESTRLKRGEPSPAASAIFDGKVVHLRGARGETLGLQFRISDGRRRELRLELPAEAAQVSGFSVGFLDVSEPSTDMYGPSRGRGSYPDVLVPAQGAIDTSELAYFDLAISDRAKPGQYRGELSSSGLSIPVLLDVSPARIDLRQDPLVWVFYLPSDIARTSGLPDTDSPELVARESEYERLFRAHGAFLAADLEPARFPARRALMHDVKYWPVAVDTSSDQAIERDVHAWLDLFRGTGVTPFAIPVDEPKSPAQKQRARHIAEVIGNAGGGRPSFLRGVTDFADRSYGDAMDVFLSPANFASTARAREPSGERFWTYNGRPPAAGSMILDTNGVALRTWGWIAERYQVELWYAWQGLYFSDRYNHGGPTDVLHDPVTFDERSRGGSDFGNSDGVLAYPGALASLRLKELRRGLEDRLLLRELDACGGAEISARVVRRMVPRALGEARGKASWSIEEPVWEHARQEVLDAIEGKCDAAALAR
ncbi:MAG TPA: hypothetical protein VGM44_04830 [Polyangiaceae bacterium]